MRTVLTTIGMVVGGALVSIWAFPDLIGNGGRSRVVVYCAQDQVHAEPLFERFRKKSGITVNAIYDSEAVKTVGLANRLLAEKARPRCDLWWANEPLRTRQLVEKGALASQGRVESFGLRRRVLVVREDATRYPRSIQDLTNSEWKGRISLALPLFGTTATHFLALRQSLGEAAWKDWCRALAENRPFLEDGNSQVVQRVFRGEAVVGLTDSDDFRVAARNRQPLRVIPRDPWTLDLPNTLALVKPAVVSGAAEQLMAFLVSHEARTLLVESGALDPDESPETRSSVGLKVDWIRLVEDIDPGTRELERLFRR